MATNTWRNHRTHAAETAAVKRALRKAGIPFERVGHGHGTAWGWLEITLPKYSQKHEMETLEIALAVTGRTGDYDGRIMVESRI